MKVFISSVNIANIITGYQSGFNYNGHEVVVLEKEKSKYYESNNFKKIYRFLDNINFKLKFMNLIKEKIDYTIQNFRCKIFLKKHIKTTDLFVFIWSPIRSDILTDYRYLKKKEKKIITVFVGSDVRYTPAFVMQYKIKEVSGWNYDMNDEDLNQKLKYIRIAELYSDMILSVPDQSGLAIRNFNHFFLPIDLKRYKLKLMENVIPKIIHAPTRKGAKGTDFFIKVLNQLKQEGIQFEFTLIQNLNNNELLNLLTESDILLDELYAHGPGMLSTEAMALGCVVVTKKDLTNIAIFDAPICNVSLENLYDVIKGLILDKNKRQEIALKARKYVEENNESKLVVNKIMQKLKTNSTEYKPEFFLKHEKTSIFNGINNSNLKLTQKVKDKFK